MEKTGSVDVELFDYETYDTTSGSHPESLESRCLLKPGEKISEWNGKAFISTVGTFAKGMETPGTETETLAGTWTYGVKVSGYKPGTDEVICAAENSVTLGMLKDAELHPDLTFTISADPDAGVGKCYEGAIITIREVMTNTGDCPVYVTWDPEYDFQAHDASSPNAPIDVPGMNGGKSLMAMLNPGESYTQLYDTFVYAIDVIREDKSIQIYDEIWYFDAEGGIDSFPVTSNELSFPLTLPGGPEDEARPELTLVWKYDEIEHYPGGYYKTTNPGVLDEPDAAFVYYDVINTGNVPLTVYCTDEFGNGYIPGVCPDMIASPLAPGTAIEDYCGANPLKNYLNADSETETLLGTVTMTIWATGHDPETGEQLCESNRIIRTWELGKPAPTEREIPDSSEITVTAGEYSTSAASEGYQYGEDWAGKIYVTNTGSVDLDAYTLHVDVNASKESHFANPGDLDATDGETWYEKIIDGYGLDAGVMDYHVDLAPNGTVTAEDVARGYITFSAYATWVDPDSHHNRTSNVSSVTLPVAGKTGLLVHKKLGNSPANGLYFTEGETIQWTVGVTNTGNDPIKNVTVTDQGVVIGEFAEIAPGETRPCTVPGYVVTEYDALMKCVENLAVAKGTDPQGITHTWNSNIASADTGLKGTDPDPVPHPEPTPGGTPETPTHKGTPGGGTDETGTIYGVKVSTSIYKTTANKPANGKYYELGEWVNYTVTITNTGNTALENVVVMDSLHTLWPVAVLPSITPGASEDVSFQYQIRQEDVNLGYVLNQVTIQYEFLEGVKGLPQTSNEVYVKAGKDGWDPDLTTIRKPPVTGDGKGDSCALILDALGGGEIRYTLHACSEHLAANRQAEATSPAEAVNLWREEIGKLYQALFDEAEAGSKAAVMNDQAAFWAYVDAYEALWGDTQALADMLRLRCAELCCMKHTAPERLPDSLLGTYAAIPGGGSFDACGQEIGALNGSDSKVKVQFNEDLARTLDQAVETVRGSKLYAMDKAFIITQRQWQIALDSTVNAVYRAADKETRKSIAACRKQLDSMIAARIEFLEALYPNNPEIVQEVIANLYRSAALDANMKK